MSDADAAIDVLRAFVARIVAATRPKERHRGARLSESVDAVATELATLRAKLAAAERVVEAARLMTRGGCRWRRDDGREGSECPTVYGGESDMWCVQCLGSVAIAAHDAAKDGGT